MLRTPSTLIVVAACLLLVASNSWAQQQTVKLIGKTITATKEPAPFVTIVAGKRGPGIVSNADGDFQLVMPAIYKDSLIHFRSIGYKPQTSPYSTFSKGIDGDIRQATVVMEEEVFQTKEVVVTPKSDRGKPEEDGRWQSAFYREYFVVDEPGNPIGKPIEMLECDYWFKRTRPRDINQNVLITNSRAKEKFGRIKLSSSYCLTSAWSNGVAPIKYFYDSLSRMDPAAKRSVSLNGMAASERTYQLRRGKFDLTYKVLLQANGDVAQINLQRTRVAGAADDKASIFSIFRLFKGRLHYTLNTLKQEVNIRYENELPIFVSSNMRFYLKFDDEEMGAPTYNTYTFLWTRTSEADAEPKAYSFRWKPGEALYRQAIRKGTNFWGLANTILPTEREEKYLKILSE